jgi:hypothetical protein
MATSDINFNKPDLTDLYTDFLDYLRNNINAIGKLDYTLATNIPIGFIRWNDTDKRFDKYSGTVWNELYTVFPQGFTMLAVQNTAPTGWARKTLLCEDNAMFCYAKTGNTTYGGSVSPQATHNHDIAGHTHSVVDHNHSIAVHSHTVNDHSHSMNNHSHSLGSHLHSAGSHTHSAGTLYAQIGPDITQSNDRLTMNYGTSFAGLNRSNDFNLGMSPIVSPVPTGQGAAVAGTSGGGSGNTGAATGNTGTATGETGQTGGNTGVGGTTTTGSAGAQTSGGSSEANTGSNTAPHYQEVIAIEKL